MVVSKADSDTLRQLETLRGAVLKIRDLSREDFQKTGDSLLCKGWLLFSYVEVDNPKEVVHSLNALVKDSPMEFRLDELNETRLLVLSSSLMTIERSTRALSDNFSRVVEKINRPALPAREKPDRQFQGIPKVVKKYQIPNPFAGASRDFLSRVRPAEEVKQLHGDELLRYVLEKLLSADIHLGAQGAFKKTLLTSDINKDEVVALLNEAKLETESQPASMLKFSVAKSGFLKAQADSSEELENGLRNMLANVINRELASVKGNLR